MYREDGSDLMARKIGQYRSPEPVSLVNEMEIGRENGIERKRVGRGRRESERQGKERGKNRKLHEIAHDSFPSSTHKLIYQ